MSPGFSMLPPEILECIMHYLMADSASLKSCSLVCLAWSYASRAQLFHTLTINAVNYKAFFNQFQDIPLPPCTAYCTTLRLVHAECLFMIDGEAYAEFILHFSDALVSLSIAHTTCPSISHLMMAMAPLHRLRTLALVHFRLEQQTTDARIYPSNGTQSIDGLSIRDTDLRNILPVVNFLAIFRNITRLDMDILTEEDFPEAGLFLISHPCIRELSLSFSETVRACSASVTAVEEEKPIPDQEKPSLQDRYLRRFGLPTSPFLRTLSSLQVICVRMFLDSRQSEQNTALIWVPKLLASTTTPTLRRVIFTLYLERAGLVDQYNVDWSFLDVVFNCQNYLEVESITFESLGPANILSLQDLISARLPMTAKRGVLRVC